MCSDGVYDKNIFDGQTIIDWLTPRLKDSPDSAAVCGELLDECLKRGSDGNMTAMIIQFKDDGVYSYHGREFIPGYKFNKNAWEAKLAYDKDARISSGYRCGQTTRLRKQMGVDKTKPQILKWIKENNPAMEQEIKALSLSEIYAKRGKEVTSSKEASKFYDWLRTPTQ